MLFLVLEACAVIRACLDGQAYEELCRHPELRTLEETGRHVLTELATAVGVSQGHSYRRRRTGARGGAHRRRARALATTLQATMRRLRDAEVLLAADMEAGWREYRRRRHGWELELAGFALYLGYDWDEVTGDGDLRLAAE